MNSASIPCPVEDVHGDGRWMSIHHRYVSETKEREPDVVFVGDSIVQRLGQSEIWEKFFEPMHALNFGVGSDRTQNLLWRLQNGELENFSPKIIVLQIGTNNHNDTAEEIVRGIETIVRYVSEKQPQAYKVVLGLLPRGHKPNPLREKVTAVNDMLPAVVAKIQKTQFVTIDPGFVGPDGCISHHDMYDYLHLTRQGNQRAFEPVFDLLTQLLIE